MLVKSAFTVIRSSSSRKAGGGSTSDTGGMGRAGACLPQCPAVLRLGCDSSTLGEGPPGPATAADPLVRAGAAFLPGGLNSTHAAQRCPNPMPRSARSSSKLSGSPLALLQGLPREAARCR